MTNKEIIDAIEAEINTAQCEQRQTNSGVKTLCLVKYIDGLRFSKDLLTKRNEANSNVPTWEQTAKDCEQILRESGDLFRECYHKLINLGETETASKVLAFCKRTHTCMSSGKKWEETDRVDL